MLVAKRYAVCDDSEFGEVRILKGQTHVDESHELARNYPSLWEPSDWRAGQGSRDVFYATEGGVSFRAVFADTIAGPVASRAPASVQLVSRPRQLPRWMLLNGSETVRLRARATPTTSMRLADDARDTIAAEIATGTARDELESGGGLLGVVTADFCDILGATGAGRDAKRERARLRIDWADVERQAQQQRLQVVGCWHTHPVRSVVNRIPSPPDTAAFSDWGRASRLPSFAALILSPDDRDRSAWLLDAWRLRRGICEPVRLPWGIE